MLPADYPFELAARSARPWRLRLLRILGLAASLILHLGVLLYLLTPVAPMSRQPRAARDAASSLQVVLLDPAPEPRPLQPLPVPIEAVQPAKQPVQTAEVRPTRQLAPARAESKPAAPIPEDAPVSAAQLFGGIEGAAHELTANDRPLPGAGMPSARARLPGSSAPIVDLPVRFKRRPTPQQVTNYLARIVIGTMVGYPDDFESATELRSPLRDLTDAHLDKIREPECNDPNDPLRDPRCLDTPRR